MRLSDLKKTPGNIIAVGISVWALFVVALSVIVWAMGSGGVLWGAPGP